MKSRLCITDSESVSSITLQRGHGDMPVRSVSLGLAGRLGCHMRLCGVPMHGAARLLHLLFNS